MAVEDRRFEINNLVTHKRIQRAEQLDPKELVSFRELLVANFIQVDALVMLMIDKGFFTKDE